MPILGLGTWQLKDHTADIVDYALALGYPMIDTSSDYGTQPGIGEGIRQNGMARDKFFITTKVEETDDAYKRTLSNLQELDLDYIDLMLIHRPPQNGAGEALWEGLIRAKKEGLVKDIGVSNYSSALIDRLITETDEVPAVNQIEWSPFGHSEEMLAYCKQKKIVIQAYSPLTRTKRMNETKLTTMANKYLKNPAQILIRWNLQLGTVPLPKANNKEHVKENLDVFDFEISDEDMQKLSGWNEEYSALGELPYIHHDFRRHAM
jgi:diketogulonate reductase-like aldo/keto reductase